jgi:hypothetical protein
VQRTRRSLLAVAVILALVPVKDDTTVRAASFDVAIDRSHVAGARARSRCSS